MNTKYKAKYKLVVNGIIGRRTYYYRHKANAKRAEKEWHSNHLEIKTVISTVYDNHNHIYMD